MLKQLRYFFTLMLLAVASVGFAGTIVFGDLGLENGVQYADPFDGGDFTVTFAGGANDGKYYTTGAGIRVYGNGTMTITAKAGTITEITITYNSSYKPAATDNVVTIGTYNAETGVWTGSANEVVFTRPSGSGHWRVQKIEVTVAGGVTKEAAELSFGENTAFVVEPNADFEAPELDNPNGLDVTYSSSDEEIALVDEQTGFVVIGSKEGTATITASSEETDDYYAGSASYTITVKDPNAKGTADNPYTVAEAIEFINTLGTSTSTDDVYVRGIISQVDSYNSKYYSITYWISDDGTTANQMQVYSGKGLNSADFASKDDLLPSDEVVVCGKVKMYNGTPEFDKNNYLVEFTRTDNRVDPALAFNPTELNVEIGEDFTEPTLTNEFGVAVTYTSSNEEVAEVDEEGSLTINGAGTATITASFAGDDNYLASEASYTLTVVDPDAPGATIDNPLTVAEALEIINGLANGGYSDSEVYVKGVISGIKSLDVSQWVRAQYYISDDGTETDQLLIYNGYYLDGADFTSNDQIAEGDEVVVYGKLQKYVKNDEVTPEVAQNNYIASIIHNETPILADAELAYPVDAFTATIDEENEFPVLENPNELEVTYKSSNEEVATIDAEGNITLVAAGETTITATSEETDAFKAGEASYVLDVIDIVSNEGNCYVKVTSSDDIVDGTYIIVCEEGSLAFNGGLETLDATNNNIDVTILGDKVIATDEVDAASFTIEFAEEGYGLDSRIFTIKSASGLYIGNTSDSNGLKSGTTPYATNITIDEDGNANIMSAVSHLRFNAASNQMRFRFYKSSSYTNQKAIQLYRKVQLDEITVPVTIGSTGYATLYYGTVALDIPDGVTASIVTAVDDKVIVFSDIDGIIPASTGVVLQGEPGNYEFVVDPTYDGAVPGNNLLNGSDVKATTEGGDLYYKLTVKNGEVGFYWGADEGAAFENVAHKAYLALPAGASNAKFFIIGKDGSVVSDDAGLVDGINEVQAESAQEYYNLNGVRVNTLRKGIYIVGGKKVIIK
ncbi:MAG: Ig-like domain-containing protein [Prevotella sp.]|nr:Ig-like domain-containing protein [Prevotella sp.]